MNDDFQLLAGMALFIFAILVGAAMVGAASKDKSENVKCEQSK